MACEASPGHTRLASKQVHTRAGQRSPAGGSTARALPPQASRRSHSTSNRTPAPRQRPPAATLTVNSNTLATMSKPVGICQANSAMLTQLSAMCAVRAASLPFCARGAAGSGAMGEARG